MSFTAGEDGDDDMAPPNESEGDDEKGENQARSTTFSTFFWEVWNRKGYQYPSETDQRRCFMFELATPFNRVRRLPNLEISFL